MGIRMAAVFGALFSIVGFIIMKFYNEKKMLSYMDKENLPDSHKKAEINTEPELL